MIPYMDLLQDLCYRIKKEEQNTLIMQNFKLIKKMMKEHRFLLNLQKVWNQEQFQVDLYL